MKKMIVLLLILLVLPFVLAEDMTRAELRADLRDNENLESATDQINQVIEALPSSFNPIGDNRVYDVQISSTHLDVRVENGMVTSITYGRPSQPTHIAQMTESTLLGIINHNSRAAAVVVALVKNRIRISAAPDCEDDFQCEDDQACDNGECKSAYTVAVVPLAYNSNELSAFLDKAEPEMELLKQYIPMDKDLLRIHYINPSVCPNYECTDVCRDCQTTARNCAQRAGLIGAADKVAAVSKVDVKVNIGGGQYLMLCGCAGGIPSYTSVSRARLYADGGVYCYNTVPHEFGHQIGLYHVDATGEEAGSCLGPNAADCQQANKKSDIMGYDWPQDHFGPAAVNYLKASPLSAYQG